MTTPRTRKVHPGQTFNMAAYAISRAALDTPDKPALIIIADVDAAPSEVWTYARLERAVLSVAAGLREKDYERGSRIAIRLENTSLYPIAFFGAIAAGYVPVAMSAELTPREVDFLVRDSGASAVVVAPGLALDALPDGVDSIVAAEVERWIAQVPSKRPMSFRSMLCRATGSPSSLLRCSSHSHTPCGSRPRSNRAR